MSRRLRAETASRKYVRVRMTNAEKAQFDRLVTLTGRTASDLIRSWMGAAIASLEGTPPVPDRTPDADTKHHETSSDEGPNCSPAHRKQRQGHSE